jgi:hypothetical protein
VIIREGACEKYFSHLTNWCFVFCDKRQALLEGVALLSLKKLRRVVYQPSQGYNCELLWDWRACRLLFTHVYSYLTLRVNSHCDNALLDSTSLNDMHHYYAVLSDVLVFDHIFQHLLS